MPGLNAVNEVIIYRGCFENAESQQAVFSALETGTPPERFREKEIRIPLRMLPDAPLPFGPEDVLLETGDVVFIEAREFDVYYTGGLLPPAEHVLPRDHDLDVIEAITSAQGPFLSGGLAPGNFAFARSKK